MANPTTVKVKALVELHDNGKTIKVGESIDLPEESAKVLAGTKPPSVEIIKGGK